MWKKAVEGLPFPLKVLLTWCPGPLDCLFLVSHHKHSWPRFLSVRSCLSPKMGLLLRPGVSGQWQIILTRPKRFPRRLQVPFRSWSWAGLWHAEAPEWGSSDAGRFLRLSSLSLVSWNACARILNPAAGGLLPQSSHAVRKPNLTHHKRALKKTWGSVARTPAAPAPASPIQTLSASTWAPWTRTLLQSPFPRQLSPRNRRDKDIAVCLKRLRFGVFCYMAIITRTQGPRRK